MKSLCYAVTLLLLLGYFRLTKYKMKHSQSWGEDLVGWTLNASCLSGWEVQGAPAVETPEPEALLFFSLL